MFLVLRNIFLLFGFIVCLTGLSTVLASRTSLPRTYTVTSSCVESLGAGRYRVHTTTREDGTPCVAVSREVIVQYFADMHPHEVAFSMSTERWQYMTVLTKPK